MKKLDIGINWEYYHVNLVVTQESWCHLEVGRLLMALGQIRQEAVLQSLLQETVLKHS